MFSLALILSFNGSSNKLDGFMIKTALYIWLTICGLTIFLSCSLAATGTGNFTISATVTAAPCTVDSSSSTQDFGDVFAGDITGKGTFKNFSLTLSNCPAGTSSVTATFSGTADAIAPAKYYKNLGSATGIGIELASNGGGAGLGNGTTMTATVDSSRKATFNLSTRINKEGSPTPGTILATVTVTYSYA